MKDKFFPSRIKLKEVYAETTVVSLHKTQKAIDKQISKIKGIKSTDEVSFIISYGKVLIMSKPRMFDKNMFDTQKTPDEYFLNFPDWGNDKDVIWGRGYESLYIAKLKFTKIITLKIKDEGNIK